MVNSTMNNENHQFNVACSPHWRESTGLAGTEQLWVIALAPALIASVYFHGFYSLRVIALTLACSVTLDAFVNWLVPSKDETSNWSSVTLAIILAFLMPVDASWWLILIGCFLMIVIGKKLFGGIGAYPVHPALLSYAMLLVSWPNRFDYTASMAAWDWGVKMIEPVRLVKTIGGSAEQLYHWQDLLLGKQVAGVGNGMVLYLLIGGLFLLLLRRITWHIPVSFLIGTLVMGEILYLSNPDQFTSPLFYLLSGGTIFAAFFLVTDYTTSPVNPIPMLIYGFLGGVLLILIRAFSNYYDGIVFAVLLVNLCNPLLDRMTPRVRGIEETSYA